jgi:hypothetical protein
MQGWCDVLGHQERFEDLLSEARRDRLILHELALRQGRGHFLRRASSWLGRLLVGWGWSLQERYAVGMEVAACAGAAGPRCLTSKGCQQVPKSR